MHKSLALLCLFGSVLSGDVFAQNQTVINGSVTAPVPLAGAGCTFNWINDQPSIGLAASGVGNIAAFTATNAGSTPVVATIMVIPASTVYAYIPNESDNTVSVVNAVSGSLVATIPVGMLPDAEAISPDGSTVYISNQGSHDVSVINTATNTVIATIPIGFPAKAIVVNHAGAMVYVASGNGVKVISTVSNTVVGTLSSGSPDGIAIDPTDQYVYTVDYASPGVVKQIDVTDNVTTFNVTAGSESFGATISPDGSRLYVTNTQSANVTVIDVATHTTIATVPVGHDPLESAVSPDGNTVYVTNSVDGTVSVIDAATNTVTATIACGSPANTPNVSADGKVLYVTAGNNLVAINTATNTISWTTAVGQGPEAIGNFLTPATCGSTPSSFTITVNPTPNIAAGAAAGYISACAGSASSSPAIQQFKVTASAATGDVTATAPAGFDVSLSLYNGYGNSVTLTPVAGALNQPVYVRSAASAPAGNISGNVTLTEGGQTEQTVAVAGFISSPPTVDPVANQIVQNGAPTAAVNFTGSGNTFTWTNSTPGIGLAADGTGNIPSFTAINTGTMPIVATISVTDKNAGFAYVGQTTANNVTVINTSTQTIVGSIVVGNDPYGMWQTPNGGLLYVANSQSNSLSAINTATQAVTATIPVGQKPVGIVGSADGSTLYVVGQGDNEVSVVNTATQTVTATIPVGSFPEAIVMTLDGATLYVTNQVDNSISVISTASHAVTGTIVVGSSPEAICLSPDGTKLYEVNDGDNNLYVISTASNTVLSIIPVGSQPHNLAISADGSTVYTANQGTDNSISVVNTASATVTATIPVGSYPDGLALSPDGSSLYVTNLNTANVMVINTATNTVTNTIPVDPDPGSLGNFVGNGGCPSQPMTFTITINPTAPVITATGDLTPMTTIYGTPSPAEPFTVSGTNLTAGLVVTPPPGFEIGTDGATFSSTVTIDVAATVSPTPIYLRLAAATPVSTYTGNITITSTGATTLNLAIPASTVTPAPLTITANDATRPYGQANPIFTFTYSGFQRNESEASLVTPPQGTTTATQSSPAGDYPIIASGAEDSNYSFAYTPGTLKITPVSMAVSIPSAFTPNGDGKNDSWDIRNLSNYRQCKVTVFNRYGQAVFTSTGYGEPWNGRQNGTDVPAGTYVYTIDLGNGSKPITGTVMVIR